MKRFKVLLASLLVVALAGTLFAFNSQKQSTSTSTIVKEEYIGVHPPTRTSLDAAASWQPLVGDPCDHVGAKLCSIEYDNAFITAAEARALIPVLNPETYVDGTVYVDPLNSNKKVKIFTKS